MRLRYEIVDVFTDRPFAGNQLAVVHGADDLSTEQCRRLAQEFGFSETTFPGSGVVDGREYSTRIFTPDHEIPFAGHPTLGTAWVLREAGLLSGADATQVCGAGPIGVRFEDDLVELSATPRDLVGPLPQDLARDVLRTVGLTLADLSGQAYVAGCGLSFVHVPVTEEAVLRAVPAARPFGRLAERLAAAGAVEDPVEGVNVHAVAGEAPRLTVHARVFVPEVGVPEDPATGSAALGYGVWLVESGLLPGGGAYTIAQGREVGRPSELRCTVEAARGHAVRATVAGQVVPIAAGQIRVP
jgi:trans-2,3-dihydro-3-hydroxyanthranilate isomerase